MRAKFICTTITKSRHYDGTGRLLYTAKLLPVTQGSEENKRFFYATPSGSIELGSFSEEHFEVNKEYYIDFLEV